MTQRRPLAAAVAVSILLAASTAPLAPLGAQSRLDLVVGASIPTRTLGPASEYRYSALAAVALRKRPREAAALRIDGLYHLGREGSFPGVERRELNVVGVTGNVSVALPASLLLRPYVIGGPGVYLSRPADHGRFTRTLGWNAGLGARYAAGRLGTFAEVRYHTVRNTPDAEGRRRSAQLLPITFGLTL